MKTWIPYITKHLKVPPLKWYNLPESIHAEIFGGYYPKSLNNNMYLNKSHRLPALWNFKAYLDCAANYWKEKWLSTTHFWLSFTKSIIKNDTAI